MIVQPIKNVRPRVSEEQVQRSIQNSLHLRGYLVLSTVHRYRKGQQAAGYGASKGVPDLLVRVPRAFGEALWLGLEVKGPSTRLSPEQQALEDAGAIVVVRSPEDAHEAVERVLREMQSRGGGE